MCDGMKYVYAMVLVVWVRGWGVRGVCATGMRDGTTQVFFMRDGKKRDGIGCLGKGGAARGV